MLVDSLIHLASTSYATLESASKTNKELFRVYFSIVLCRFQYRSISNAKFTAMTILCYRKTPYKVSFCISMNEQMALIDFGYNLIKY